MASDSRLTLAADRGLFTLPDGPIVVFGAESPDALSVLPVDRTCAVQTLRPAHDDLQSAGFRVVTTPPDRADLAIVVLPRSKDLARAWIAAAADLSTGPVVIDGPKTHGIDSLLRELRGRWDVSEALLEGW